EAGHFQVVGTGNRREPLRASRELLSTLWRDALFERRRGAGLSRSRSVHRGGHRRRMAAVPPSGLSTAAWRIRPVSLGARSGVELRGRQRRHPGREASMKTFLVTGGAGFIGSNFVHHLYTRHPEDRILVLDLLTYAGSVDNLPSGFHGANGTGRVEFWYGDVRNASLVDSL